MFFMKILVDSCLNEEHYIVLSTYTVPGLSFERMGAAHKSTCADKLNVHHTGF